MAKGLNRAEGEVYRQKGKMSLERRPSVNARRNRSGRISRKLVEREWHNQSSGVEKGHEEVETPKVEGRSWGGGIKKD